LVRDERWRKRRVYMLENTDEGHTNLVDTRREDTLDCPVCGRLLQKGDLADVQSVVEDNLYDLGGVRLVDSHVRLECDVEHRFDEKGFTLDEPHDLVVVVDAAFDESGSCVQFVIIGVVPAG
jgi:hypothetical protein